MSRSVCPYAKLALYDVIEVCVKKIEPVTGYKHDIDLIDNR